MSERIRTAGGALFAVTSEPQRLADAARDTWDLDFEVIGDPHQEIEQVCRERGWLTLYVATDFDYLRRCLDWEPQHPKGYYQPGVLALEKSDRVLYAWRCVPWRRTMGGAAARPGSAYMWGRVQRALDAGPDAGDARHDDTPLFGRRVPPYVPFLLLLLANGWFLWVRPFVFSPGLPPLRTRILKAAARLVAFVAIWIAALIYLPPLPVAGVFAVWAVWIVLKERHFVLEQFPDNRG